jgi:hypothetical protein
VRTPVQSDHLARELRVKSSQWQTNGERPGRTGEALQGCCRELDFRFTGVRHLKDEGSLLPDEVKIQISITREDSRCALEPPVA